MKILDVNDNIIENPDLEIGKLEIEERNVIHRYEITQYEQGHYETIKEYENGGKDVVWTVDIPEKGCWVAYDKDGNVIMSDIVIPDDMPHEIEVPSVEEFYRYVLYTEEELLEIEEQNRLAEEAAAKVAEQEAFLEEAPARLDATETCIAALTSAFGEVV